MKPERFRPWGDYKVAIRLFLLIFSTLCVTHVAIAAAAESHQPSVSNGELSSPSDLSKKSAKSRPNRSQKSETGKRLSTKGNGVRQESAVGSEPRRQFSFQQLDKESEQLLKEVLDLSSDLAIVEEQQNNPAKFQLLVLVTMAPTDLFKLDYIELKIDNQTVAAHNYTSSEHNALQLGGGQRLYVANLPAGMHKLYASMAGRVPRDPDYKSAVDYSFISGVSRTVLELSVSGAQTRGFPILQVVEHN